MIIPKGWKKCRIDELGEVQGGRQRSPKAKGKPRPYLRVANVFDNYISTTDVFQMPFTDNEYERFVLRKGDILLNEGQSLELVGRSATYMGAPQNTCFQNTLVRFRANTNTDIAFAQKLFNYCQVTGRFMTIASRTTSIAHLGVNRFASMKVSVPPLEEQRKIANLLDVWDNAITLTEKLIAEKQLRRKRLMQQLLTGKRRLPGFDGEWRDVRLGGIFNNRTESGRTDLPLLSITAGRGVIPRDEIKRKDNSNTDKQKYLHIRPGDIGYNTMRMWQGVSALSALEGIVSPAYTIVTPKDGIDGQFMALFFKYPPVVYLFYRYSQGLVSDTWNLKFRHFSEIKITIPKEDEQRAIASVFKTIDQEIELLQTKVDTLRKQKKGLMQQLLTGKVRVTL